MARRVIISGEEKGIVDEGVGMGVEGVTETKREKTAEVREEGGMGEAEEEEGVEEGLEVGQWAELDYRRLLLRRGGRRLGDLGQPVG